MTPESTTASKAAEQTMRAAFKEWVQDRGCDTDGAWSAWQACWNRRPSSPQAQQADAVDAELGRTAMRFVDRAGDVHPGIDDAETICAEFYKAMSGVIDKHWNGPRRADAAIDSALSDSAGVNHG